MSVAAFEDSQVRLGRARGRYFRENFAQGGVDLVQIFPELVTNADAAIAATGRPSGQITLTVAPPDSEFLAAWRTGMRRLGSPALLSWRYELRCTDDGEGVDAQLVDRRLGALGVEPPQAGQRGLFGRGLRDVWLAQGAGRIEGVRAGRLVESWFFPAPGDEPYAFMHVQDRPATRADLNALGVAASGTRVTVPLARRLPPAGRLRALVCQLVQLRPILEDPARQLYLGQPGQMPQLVAYPAPEPDPDR
ncbi:MAG: ATP-binding protein, partial [Solirubrobacteraceae bacterium]